MTETYKDFAGIDDTIIHLLEQFYSKHHEVLEEIRTILDSLYDAEEKISEYIEEGGTS